MSSQPDGNKTVEELYQQAMLKAKSLRNKAEDIEKRATSFRQDALEFAQIGAEQEETQAFKDKIVSLARMLYDELDDGNFKSGTLRLRFRSKNPNASRNWDFEEIPWHQLITELIYENRLKLVEKVAGRLGSLITLGSEELQDDADAE